MEIRKYSIIGSNCITFKDGPGLEAEMKRTILTIVDKDGYATLYKMNTYDMYQDGMYLEEAINLVQKLTDKLDQKIDHNELSDVATVAFAKAWLDNMKGLGDANV